MQESKQRRKSIVQRQVERRTDEKAAADRAVAGMARRQQPQRGRVQESKGCYSRAEDVVRLLLLLSAPISALSVDGPRILRLLRFKYKYGVRQQYAPN